MSEDVPRVELQRSSRDPDAVRRRLEAWLARRLPEGAAPTLTDDGGTSANGMSSDTVLFRATWTEGGTGRDHRLVARLAPDRADVPVFPHYDLARQFHVIRKVGELTPVPVPEVWWLEPSPDPIGTPFFVMDRIDGQVPPDIMPYNFGDNWLFAASPEDQQRLQVGTLAVLAELHGIAPVDEHLAFLELPAPGDTALRRHVAHTRAWYEFAAADVGRSPLVERAFAWLDDHWPDDEGAAVLSWGDARIGNVLYRDFEPVGVLDWEMAGLGPRELDVAWMIYAHRVFEDIAAQLGLEGMPHFLRRDDVAAGYEARTGHTPRDLDFYLLYAATQWGVVGLRTGARQVHFGERELPDDVDELLLNRDSLEPMLAGTYWS